MQTTAVPRTMHHNVNLVRENIGTDIGLTRTGMTMDILEKQGHLADGPDHVAFQTYKSDSIRQYNFLNMLYNV